MRVKLCSTLALALVAAVAVWAAQPDRTTTPGGQPDKGGKGGDKAVSLDGEWTVVSAARDGSAMDKVDKMAVTIKGNVVTFGGTGADDKSKMKALRLDFGSSGTIRVTESGADGKFGTGTGGTGGTGTDKGGTTPPAGGGRDMAGPLSGVYVMTPDYLAISVFTSGTGGTGGTRPGTGGTGGTGSTPPAGGTGGTSGTQPGGTGAGGTTGSTTGPQMMTHLSVVLKRSSGARP